MGNKTYEQSGGWAAKTASRRGWDLRQTDNPT